MYVAWDGLGIILKTKCGISFSQGLCVFSSGQWHLRKGLSKKICQKGLLKHPYKIMGSPNICPVAMHFACDSIFRSLTITSCNAQRWFDIDSVAHP